MKTIAILSILSTLAIGSQALVPVQRLDADLLARGDQLVTRFQTGSSWACNKLDQEYSKYLSQVTKPAVCTEFAPGTKSIKISFLDPKCRGMF